MVRASLTWSRNTGKSGWRQYRAEEDQMSETELDVGPIDYLVVEFPGAS